VFTLAEGPLFQGRVNPALSRKFDILTVLKER